MGIATTNLSGVDRVEEIIANQTRDGIRKTGRIAIEKLALQLAGTGPLNALAAGALLFETKASLDASLDHEAPLAAWVFDDPTPGNNGIYSFVEGTPNSWQRQLDLPFSLVKLTDAGTGTANAIVATSNLPLPTLPYLALLLLELHPDYPGNTAATTIAINGAAPRPLLSVTGSPMSEGYLAAGQLLAFVDAGASFKLLSDITSAGNLAQAEASRDKAREWAEADEDQLVEDITGGDDGYSAFHWAKKSEAQADRSENEANRSEAGATAAALSETGAAGSALTATGAATIAVAAAEASGALQIFDAKAAATAALGGLSDGTVVEVLVDESRQNRRTRYRVEAGVLVFKLNVSPTVRDVVGRVQIEPRLLGHRSAGLRLRKALADLAAGTRKSLRVLTLGDSLATINWACGHMQLGRLFEPHMQSTPVYGYNFGGTLRYALAGVTGNTAAASAGYNATKSNATLNQKTDYDTSFDGTNVEIASGQRAIFSIGNNTVYCDTIYIPIITEPGAGSVKIELVLTDNPPNYDSGTWVNVTSGQIASAHSLTGSELIIDANATLGATVVKLSVARAGWAIKVTHSAGGAVRMLFPMFEVAGAAAINQWRIGNASNDFSSASTAAVPAIAALIAAYNPDIIAVESDDRRAAYENFLPILEQTIAASGLSHPPLVVLIGNPFYSNGPYTDADIADRIAFMHDFASTRVGWDVIDMMALSGGLAEAARAGWSSDGIHYNGEIAWQAVRTWGIARGYYAFQPKEPGGYASFSDINRAFSQRQLTAEKIRALACSPAVHDTSSWTWASLLTGTGSMAKSSVSSYLNLASGATADSKVVAYLNESVTPIGENQSIISGAYAAALTAQIRVTASNANGALRLLWAGDRAYNAAHGGTLTGVGVGFEVLNDTIKGICWDGALVTSDYTVAMAIGATARAYQLQMVLTPYQTVAGAYSASFGVVEWFVNGISLGRERYTMGNMFTPRFELTNGATAAQYSASVVPPKVMSIFREVTAA